MCFGAFSFGVKSIRQFMAVMVVMVVILSGRGACSGGVVVEVLLLEVDKHSMLT